LRGAKRSFHVKNPTAKTLRETAVKIASRKSYLMTDENAADAKLGKEFSGHATTRQTNLLAWAALLMSTELKIIFRFSSAA
jgi:hypothetical protein